VLCIRIFAQELKVGSWQSMRCVRRDTFSAVTPHKRQTNAATTNDARYRAARGDAVR
jgi:hypothetical protein